MPKLHKKDSRIAIANRIKQARIEAKMSQRELGDLLFCHPTNISHLEQGRISVPADKLIEFSEALNKPIIYFLSDI